MLSSTIRRDSGIPGFSDRPYLLQSLSAVLPLAVSVSREIVADSYIFFMCFWYALRNLPYSVGGIVMLVLQTGWIRKK